LPVCVHARSFPLAAVVAVLCVHISLACRSNSDGDGGGSVAR
jgi:hypothetical protein